MANEYSVNQSDLVSVANAIREKGGTSETLVFPDGFVGAVQAIQAGGGNFSVETGSITFAESYKPNSTPLVISHSLGKTPFAFIAYNGTARNNPKYQIAYLYKLGLHIGSSTARRSEYSTIMYATAAGTGAISASSASDTITLSSDVITISGTSSVADFNPDTSGSYTSTLVWFAIAQH